MPKKIKVGAYVINLDEYANIEAHWIGLYVSDSGVTVSELNTFLK